MGGMNGFDYGFDYCIDYSFAYAYDYSFSFGFGYDFTYGNRKGPHKQSLIVICFYHFQNIKNI